MRNELSTMMIYEDVPGGRELLEWFGEEPSFHDAEILSLRLNRAGQSTLKIHGWIMTLGAGGDLILHRHAVVTFTLEGIMDLQLDGFSPQNVIYGLKLQRATDRGRNDYYPLPKSPDDIEIELEPCYGLDGVIRAKKVSISFRPGMPEERSDWPEGAPRRGMPMVPGSVD